MILSSTSQHVSNMFFLISEIFKPPIRVTNCGHSFCERCIVPRYTEPGWLCPLCKHLQINSAAALVRNFSLEPIAVSFQRQPPRRRKPIGEFGRCKQQSHQQDITLCKHTSNHTKIVKLVFTKIVWNIRRICVFNVPTKKFVEGSQGLIVRRTRKQP